MSSFYLKIYTISIFIYCFLWFVDTWSRFYSYSKNYIFSCWNSS